jgi:hypothetical protein
MRSISPFFFALIVFSVSSCSQSGVVVPKEKSVPVVSIPLLPEAPDVAPVDRAAREVRDGLSAAREDVVKATGKLEVGVLESRRLRELTQRAYDEAQESMRGILSEIREAAAHAEERLTETLLLLRQANLQLVSAREKSEFLAVEISELKAHQAVQNSAIVQFRKSAEDANENITLANGQKDIIRDALNEAVASELVAIGERDRLRGNNFKLWIAVVVLGLLLGLAGYVILKV